MYRPWLWIVVLVVAWAAPAAAVVGGAPAAPPEPDAAVVFVHRKGRSARIEGTKNDRLGYYSFFGIRYAQPPLGRRRFTRPVREYLGGDLNATTQCLPCPQRDPYYPSRVIGHEDCLCLNVFAPKMPGDERGCPVVFFIHGGNFKSGSTSSYGGQHLTQKDTILVTAQYRLGSLGYLSTDQRDASGNVGLFDIHTAMAWIQDYIEFFGGDPTRVVVMGQGSGGSAASIFAMSNEGRSATGVAALSGAPLSPGAVRPNLAKHADLVAERTGCPKRPVESLVNCLRQLPVEKIVMADEGFDMENVDTTTFLDDVSGRSGAGVRVEGEDDLRSLLPIISEKPADSLNEKVKRVPMLTGVTSAETKRVVYGKYNKFLSNQLQLVKDFIKNDLVGGLQGVLQGVEGLIPLSAVVQSALPITLPDYYQALFSATLNTVDGLAQIAEATGDALFNFPAYQSVKAWSAGGPAYLYSFEHTGNLSKGSHFLPGLALTDSSDIPESEKKMIKGPAHGDELAYIFEPLGPDGVSVAGDVSSTDARVRDSFVGLISKFAHGLGSEETKNGSNFFGLSPFLGDNDQFLKITDEIKIDKNFRFCQMGLWGGMADRLTGALCQNLIGNLLSQITAPLPLGNLPLQNLPVNNLPLDNGALNQGLLNQGPLNLGQQNQGLLNQGPLNLGQQNQGLLNQGPLNLGQQNQGLLNQGLLNQETQNQGLLNQLPLNNAPLHATKTTEPPRVVQQKRRTTRRSLFGLPIDL